MNDIINRLLLGGDKFMLEMHVKPTGFTCSACGPFTKNKKKESKNQKKKQEIPYILTKMN